MQQIPLSLKLVYSLTQFHVDCHWPSSNRYVGHYTWNKQHSVLTVSFRHRSKRRAFSFRAWQRNAWPFFFFFWFCFLPSASLNQHDCKFPRHAFPGSQCRANNGEITVSLHDTTRHNSDELSDESNASSAPGRWLSHAIDNGCQATGYHLFCKDFGTRGGLQVCVLVMVINS